MPTPVGEAELASAVARGHLLAFGRKPTASLVACAWAQLCLEHARGRAIYNYNAGNVTAFFNWGGPYYTLEADEFIGGKWVKKTLRYRSHEDIDAGVKNYFEVLRATWPLALGFFEKGNASAAAEYLSRNGYFTAPLEDYYPQKPALDASGKPRKVRGYRSSLVSLFQEYQRKYTQVTGMTKLRPFLEGWAPTGVHSLDIADLRERAGDFYRSHESLRSSGKTEREYEALIFPNDTESFRRQAADDMWSCALRFQAGLRGFGVEHALLSVPYASRPQKAVIDAATVARHFGALVEGPALARYEPQAGDALCHGPANNPHVSCVNRAHTEPGGALVLDCSDGGQGRKGDMAIERNIYIYEAGRVASVEGPTYSLERPGPWRPVVWAVDLEPLLVNADVLAGR